MASLIEELKNADKTQPAEDIFTTEHRKIISLARCLKISNHDLLPVYARYGAPRLADLPTHHALTLIAGLQRKLAEQEQRILYAWPEQARLASLALAARTRTAPIAYEQAQHTKTATIISYERPACPHCQCHWLVDTSETLTDNTTNTPHASLQCWSCRKAIPVADVLPDASGEATERRMLPWAGRERAGESAGNDIICV